MQPIQGGNFADRSTYHESPSMEGVTTGMAAPARSNAAPSQPGRPTKTILRLVTSLGLAASLFGFLEAYIWLPKSDAGFFGFALVTLGLVAALYGFAQAYQAIRLWRIVIPRPWVAGTMTTAGMMSCAYGFFWAFRGPGPVADSTFRLAGYVLVGAGAAAALFGFAKAYVAVWRCTRRA